MLTLPVMGCDPHLDTIAAAVLDGIGNEIVSVTVTNTTRGWAHLNDLCRDHHVEVVGIEGASGFGRCLSQSLTRTGVEVREIPTRFTARTRRVDGAGKTDPGDARTVARAVARGEGNQWADQPDLETIRVLTTRRNHLVTAQTADINHLRALLTEIDPERAAQLPRVRSAKQFQQLATIEYTGDTHRETVSQIIREIAGDCYQRHNRILELSTRIEKAMPPVGQDLIDTIEGCGPIVAATILSNLAGAGRFKTQAAMAAWAGTAPLDASSGRQQRHRLNPGGNRQVNRAIHTIVLTQLAHKGKAHDYVERKKTEGKTKTEAIRAAKRQTIRRIWKTIRNHGLT